MSSILTLLHNGVLVDGLHALTLVIPYFLDFIEGLELLSQKLLRHFVTHSLWVFVNHLCGLFDGPVLNFSLRFRYHLLAG